jgi:hypothetical protein
VDGLGLLYSGAKHFMLAILLFSLLLPCFPLWIVDGGAITSSSAGMVG